MKISSKIPFAYNGFSLIDYLSARFTYLERGVWRERIAQRLFTRDDAVLDENTPVFHKEIVVYDMPDFDEPPANFNYEIIKQTDDYLVIDKPPGLLVHKQGINFSGNLIYHLRDLHEPPFPTADIVNRLDRDTSGIVLVSLNKNALRKLLAQFADRSVKKTYFAIVVGTPDPPCGEICAPIGKIKDDVEKSNNKGRFCKVDFNDGKPCQTFYETVKSANGHSLVKLFPKTGRTHQLRIHLSYIKTPIVGDLSYGMDADEYKKYCEYNKIIPVETQRQLLHCAEVQFSFGGKPVCVRSELPDGFDI